MIATLIDKASGDVNVAAALLLGVALLLSLLVFLRVVRHPTRANASAGSPEARERARALLRELLTEEEQRKLAASGYLEVSSPNEPKRLYHIPASGGMVEVYESGVLAARLCLIPMVPLPEADLVLMHKLMIEANEEEYLRKANLNPPASPAALRRESGARARAVLAPQPSPITAPRGSLPAYGRWWRR